MCSSYRDLSAHSGDFAGLVLPLSRCLVNRDSETNQVFPGRPDQSRNPGLQDISTMVKQDQQDRPTVPTNPDRSCTYLVLRAHSDRSSYK